MSFLTTSYEATIRLCLFTWCCNLYLKIRVGHEEYAKFVTQFQRKKTCTIIKGAFNLFNKTNIPFCLHLWSCYQKAILINGPYCSNLVWLEKKWIPDSNVVDILTSPANISSLEALFLHYSMCCVGGWGGAINPSIHQSNEALESGWATHNIHWPQRSGFGAWPMGLRLFMIIIPTKCRLKSSTDQI